MTNVMQAPIKLFQYPRIFGIPNLSPFCCKLETWLRIARIPYEVVDTPDPRRAPKGKLPFIEDAGVPIADTSIIVDLRRKCERELPVWMVPRYIEIRSELPTTPTQKIEKHRLKQEGVTPATIDLGAYRPQRQA